MNSGTQASTPNADRMRIRLQGGGQLPSQIERTPPDIPDHTLIRRIGRGSYGEVWLARNVLGSFRAVKIVYRDAFSDERPYQREFEGIRKFEPISRSSEGFIHVLQIGRNDPAGCFYCVMELADDLHAATATIPPKPRNEGDRGPATAAQPGSTTSRRTRVQSPISNPDEYVPTTLAELRQQRGRFPVAECAELGLALAAALAHLHAHGLLHRDIKPSNIIFVNGVPKIADIGLVAQTDEARSFVGTEGFIPPEGPNSAQSDIYSLGKVLYEIAMGRDRHDFPEPFSGLWESSEAEPLLELNAIILRACATDLRERYQSADEMAADVSLLRSGKSVRRHRALRSRLSLFAKAAAVLILLAVVGFGFNWWLEQRVADLQARPSVGSGRLEGRIQPRDPEANPNHLNLAAHYNALLDEAWFGPDGNDLGALPRGLQRLGDVDFDLRGALQLAGSTIIGSIDNEFPRAVRGLGVGLYATQLHFLHGTISGTGEGQEVGRYIVHYANGGHQAIPIRYGSEVRDYWNWSGAPQDTTNAVVAWRGDNAATRERGFNLRLYRSTWENPAPDLRIDTVDFVSRGSVSAPFLLAVTAEPNLARVPGVDHNIVAHVQADTAHYQRVRIGRDFGQPDFQRVRLNTAGHRTGPHYYDAIRITTPPDAGWDLVWVGTLTGLASCEAWQISPVDGGMRVGFEDWYHGPANLYRNLPDDTSSDITLQFLDGKKLRPNTDYLIWFTFREDQAADLWLGIVFVPPGQVSPGRPETLEAALGLARAEGDISADDMTFRTNCGPNLHRHFCLSGAHW